MQFKQFKISIWLCELVIVLLAMFAITFIASPITVLADNGNIIVHITATGKCYHREGCFHLRSDYEITLYEAVVVKGYNPCEDCNPPIYDGPEPLHEKMEKSKGGSSSSTQTTKAQKSETVPLKTQETKDNTALRVFLGIIAVIGGLFVINYILETYLAIKERRAKEKAEKELFEHEQKKYMALYAHKDPITLVEVPEGSFIKGGLPCTDNASKGIYGDYTVYVAQSRGRVLHMRPTCGSNLKAINYYYVSKRPHCQKCATGYNVNLPKIDWYDDYLKICEIKKKYNIP